MARSLPEYVARLRRWEARNLKPPGWLVRAAEAALDRETARPRTRQRRDLARDPPAPPFAAIPHRVMLPRGGPHAT